MSEIVCEVFGNAINNANDDKVIKHYKSLYKERGISLKTNKKYNKTIKTINGDISFQRYALRPKTETDYENLKLLDGKTTVSPMDEYLNIAKLPGNMTVSTMLEIAEWTTSQLSLQASVDAIVKAMKMKISHQTARYITSNIGKIIYENDLNDANNVYNKFFNGKFDANIEQKDGI
jgi:hypothetical protein